MRHWFIPFLLLFVCSATSAGAAISDVSAKMLQASKLAAAAQFPEAVQLYTEVIAADPDNIDAYLQRAYSRREMKDTGRVLADATVVVKLADAFMKQKGQTAKLLYQRGSGYRLLKDYKAARRDIEAAIRAGRNNRWADDLQAIALEEKMNSAPK